MVDKDALFMETVGATVEMAKRLQDLEAQVDANPPPETIPKPVKKRQKPCKYFI